MYAAYTLLLREAPGSEPGRSLAANCQSAAEAFAKARDILAGDGRWERVDVFLGRKALFEVARKQRGERTLARISVTPPPAPPRTSRVGFLALAVTWLRRLAPVGRRDETTTALAELRRIPSRL